MSKDKLEFIAIDGDDVGVSISRYIVNNDIVGVKEYSENLTKFFIQIAETLANLNCEVVFCGGDSVLAIGKLTTLLSVINDLQKIFPISVGIGKTPEIAYLALQLAKTQGKSRAVYIDQISTSIVQVW